MKSDDSEFEPVEPFCFTAHEDNISKASTNAKIDLIFFTYIHLFKIGLSVNSELSNT